MEQEIFCSAYIWQRACIQNIKDYKTKSKRQTTQEKIGQEAWTIHKRGSPERPVNIWKGT